MKLNHISLRISSQVSGLIAGSNRRVVANVLDCDILVSEFELRSHIYIQFRTNTPRKGMNSFIPRSARGLNNTSTVPLQG